MDVVCSSTASPSYVISIPNSAPTTSLHKSDIMVFIYCGLLAGHRGWVTSMVTPHTPSTDGVQLISASRDKSVILWAPPRRAPSSRASSSSLLDSSRGGLCRAEKKLEGHAHFIVDVALSLDGTCIATASWDTVVRLWDVASGVCVRRFNGHSKDVNAVAFLAGTSSLVASGGKDRSIRVWAAEGGVLACNEDAHDDWVSALRPLGTQNGSGMLVSTGWDGRAKIWWMPTNAPNGRLVCIGVCDPAASGPSAPLPATPKKEGPPPLLHCAVSPDYSLIATVSKDGRTRLWDITGIVANAATEKAVLPRWANAAVDVLVTIDGATTAGTREACHQVSFAPHQFYVCIAADSCVRIFDLTVRQVVAELVPEIQDRSKRPQCTSLAWAPDGSVLYTGYTDNTIRMWGLPN